MLHSAASESTFLALVFMLWSKFSQGSKGNHRMFPGFCGQCLACLRLLAAQVFEGTFCFNRRPNRTIEHHQFGGGSPKNRHPFIVVGGS